MSKNTATDQVANSCHRNNNTNYYTENDLNLYLSLPQALVDSFASFFTKKYLNFVCILTATQPHHLQAHLFLL